MKMSSFNPYSDGRCSRRQQSPAGREVCRVSILVVVEDALEEVASMQLSGCIMVSILVVVEDALEGRLCFQLREAQGVSILVVVEDALEELDCILIGKNTNTFQSLLWWKMLSKTLGDAVDIVEYNVSILVVVEDALEVSPEARAIAEQKFQSLLWWKMLSK